MMNAIVNFLLPALLPSHPPSLPFPSLSPYSSYLLSILIFLPPFAFSSIPDFLPLSLPPSLNPPSPLSETATGSERSDFFTEIETMKCVAEGNNPHVVNMIGCATLQEPIRLVTEFVKFGDLLSYLTTIRRLVSGSI